MEDKILKILNDTTENLTINDLGKILNVDSSEFKQLIITINKLEDEGIVYISKNNHLFLADKLNIFIGKIKSIKKYYAICLIKKEFEEREIEIEKENLNNAYINDTVRVQLKSNNTGVVLNVLKHDLWHLVVEYQNKKFVYDDKFFPYKLQILNNKKFHLVNGHIILLKVKKYNKSNLECEIEKILGHHNDPGIDILEMIYKSGVPNEFSEQFINKTNDYLNNKKIDYQGRKDLTNLLICSIDGVDAKDLDDAVSLSILPNGNYYLGVHIADVSYFVEEKSFLDKEAFKRGTSIYLADRVIPMLPHAISNGVCSLNPHEIKLTMSCFMEFDGDGKLINYDICPSYINSSHRLNYDDVNKLFHHEETTYTYPDDLKSMLFNMLKLSKILRKKMIDSGYLSLDISEAKLVMDYSSHRILKIEKRIQDDAEELIENFMIAANETVASFVYYQQLPFIYRVHPAPSLEKLQALSTSLKELNINLNIKPKTFSSKVLQTILDQNKDNNLVISQLILRSMSKAKYSVENVGHFGIGSFTYTHFTSPIRRYPDLIVHRYLKKYLLEHNYDTDLEFLIMAAENSSICERRAMFLERDVEDVKKAEYMQNFIGCIYEGYVTGVMDFGIFVELDNTCEGLMRFETIDNYYQYDFNYLKNKFHIGSKLLVRVISVNIKNGEINFGFEKKNNIINNKGGNKNAKKRHHQ